MPRSPLPRSVPAGFLTACLSLALITGLALAQEVMIPVYMPLVARDPTFTPTITPSPTLTPTVTNTPPSGSPNDIQANLSLCNPGQTIYPVGSTVCVVETLHNAGAGTVAFGLVGVAVNPGNGFQTSWNASPDPNKQYWTICPGCTGPMDGSGGAWQDNIRGANNSSFDAPGQYALTLAVCYDTIQACASGQANQDLWRIYNTLSITIQ
jgi:hypothetical protein